MFLFKVWLKDKVLLWASVIWFVVGFTLDQLSSRHFSIDWFESNPYARDVWGNFVWAHALAYDWIWFAVMLTLCSILYFGIRRFSEFAAQACFASVFLAIGFGSYAAAIHNMWVRLGWFIPVSLLR